MDREARWGSKAEAGATRKAGEAGMQGAVEEKGACAWEATTHRGSLGHWMPGQPLLNRHQVGLLARHGVEPTRDRPAVRGKGTTRVPHTDINNPPPGARVPTTRPQVPLTPPSVPSRNCLHTRER